MVRFKVVKGGTLLLAFAVLALLAVVAVILFSGTGSAPASNATGNAAAVLADAPVPVAENEHTDAILPQGIVTQSLSTRNGKRVLIYHTHTHEAYQPAYEGEYEALESWRTDDNAHNVVRVGDELTELLEAKGFEVVHLDTDHEQDDLSTSYSRSLETLTGYSAEEFDLIVDLHRDAYTEGAQLTCSYGGADSAKLMVLVGTGEKFADKPDFEANYDLGCRLTSEINAVCPGLCRDVMVKTGRYNQQFSDHSLLIEVGNNRNTLDEALSSMPALADAIQSMLLDEPAQGQLYTVSAGSRD